MEIDPTRACELLVGLPAVNVLGVDDASAGPLRVHIETRGDRRACSGYGPIAWAKDR